MKGFFSKAQTKSHTRPTGKNLSCIACGLYREVLSPKMKPFGNFKKGIMNIGTSPGELEDMRGKQWQGKGGTLLRQTYKVMGVDLYEDCINLYAANCHPKGKGGHTRRPGAHEVDCCRRIVMDAIRQYKPKVIILFGDSAVRSVIGGRWKKDIGTIQKWSGWRIPDIELECWVCPVFDPEFVHKENKQEITTIWAQDLQQAVRQVNKKLPVYNEPKITYLDENDLTPLNTVKEQTRLIAFDYEATGLKPHKPEHEIVCASVAVNEDEVYTFLMPKKRSKRLPFIKLLTSQYLYKMAHNIKYEDTWTVEKLNGTSIVNWKWDSLQAAHILDHRTSVSSLKFQTYVHFGVVDYDSEISPFLEGLDPKDANSLNRVKELLKSKENTKKLLKYCALDSIYEYRLAIWQQKQIGV